MPGEENSIARAAPKGLGERPQDKPVLRGDEALGVYLALDPSWGRRYENCDEDNTTRARNQPPKTTHDNAPPERCFDRRFYSRGHGFNSAAGKNCARFRKGMQRVSQAREPRKEILRSRMERTIRTGEALAPDSKELFERIFDDLRELV